MNERERFAALRERPLSDHTPFCNYGQTNGVLMCTCHVLVEILEASDVQLRAADAGDRSAEASTSAEAVGTVRAGSESGSAGAERRGSRSEQRARRLAANKAKRTSK